LRSIFICDRAYFKIGVIFGISVKLPNCMYSQYIGTWPIFGFW
jgi:hypothetical protein